MWPTAGMGGLDIGLDMFVASSHSSLWDGSTSVIFGNLPLSEDIPPADLHETRKSPMPI